MQGLLRVRGRPAVAYDQQGLVFAVAMEGGAIKLFDVRSYDKVRLRKVSHCMIPV
jgi:COMPASS component SWD2